MDIRTAKETDIPRMVAIAETKRVEYEGYSPIFWRKYFLSHMPQEQLINIPSLYYRRPKSPR